MVTHLVTEAPPKGPHPGFKLHRHEERVGSFIGAHDAPYVKITEDRLGGGHSSVVGADDQANEWIQTAQLVPELESGGGEREFYGRVWGFIVSIMFILTHQGLVAPLVENIGHRWVRLELGM